MPVKIPANAQESTDITINPPASAGRNFNKIGLIILFFLAFLFLGSTTYYYRENSKLKNNYTQKAAQESIAELISKVSKLIVLPKDETPVIATVTDPEKLKKEQPFFANASIGDKILIYTGARQAFMYSPELNKIIQVSPILIGSPNPEPTPIPLAAEPPTLPAGNLSSTSSLPVPASPTSTP
ncbi:MAG: hypothetical protein AAB467_02520 [Patescibacteria group bacterium]